jgi:inosose dehydratase
MANIRVGNAPCSWGALEFEGLDGESAGYRRVLDEMAETGYAGTELGDWGFMPTDPEALRSELAPRGLTLAGAFVPAELKNVPAHASGLAVALKTARLLKEVSPAGNEPFLVLADDNGINPLRTNNAGHVTPTMGLTPKEWRIFAQGAEEIARAVHTETGLRTVFHHHCAGYVETPDEIACLLEHTDPELVGLVLDTGHYAYGAGDGRAVLDALERYGERIRHVHFKDCSLEISQQAKAQNWDYFEAVRQGVFCELGMGCVDFPAVVAWLNARNYSGWVIVEQDVLPGMGAPKESAQRNREYLRSIGL